MLIFVSKEDKKAMKKQLSILLISLSLILNIRAGKNPDSQIDSIVKDGIAKRAFPGCQVVVLRDGKTIYDKCFGTLTYESKQKVQPTTIYDVASVTKTTATLLAIMKLYDDGKLRLTDKASQYLPFLRGTDKESLTITDLLLHETGFPGSLFFYRSVLEKGGKRFKEGVVSATPAAGFSLKIGDSLYLCDRFHDDAMQMIANARLNPKTFVYSCVNFILLKEIAETISGTSLDRYLDRGFYQPMKLKYTAFCPLRTQKKEDIAPTIKNDILRKGPIQGYVHDPDAAFLGGVSGNAGLFSTAREVAKIHQMLLNMGELDGKRYLSEETCRIFTTTTSENGRRGLGFDKPNTIEPNSNPCSALAPAEMYGHTGYTGTACWVDPVNKLIIVFLSNRTYPDDGMNRLSRLKIRPKIQDAIYQSLKK
jgi:CubicO group peptidase (beta-lactamase class C family)